MISTDIVEIQSKFFSLHTPRCSLPKSQGNLLWRRQIWRSLTKVILNNYPGGGMEVLGSKRRGGGSVCVIGLLDRMAKSQGDVVVSHR